MQGLGLEARAVYNNQRENHSALRAWPCIQRTASALSLPLAVAQFGGISACSLTASSSLVSWTACSTIAFAAWR